MGCLSGQQNAAGPPGFLFSSSSLTALFPSLSLSDVDVPSPDEKSVITYVSSIYDAFPKVPEGGEGISATVSSVQIDRLVTQIALEVGWSKPLWGLLRLKGMYALHGPWAAMVFG